MTTEQLRTSKSATRRKFLTGAAVATAATVATAFNIQRNNTNVGMMVFTASAATATFTMSSATVFTAGDVLTVVAPATPDATLANLAWTFMGIAQ